MDNKEDNIKALGDQLTNLLGLVENQKDQFLEEFASIKEQLVSLQDRIQQSNKLNEEEQEELLEDIHAFMDELSHGGDEFDDEEEIDSLEDLQNYLQTMYSLIDQVEDNSIENKEELKKSIQSIQNRLEKMETLKPEEQEELMADVDSLMEELHSQIPHFMDDEEFDDLEEEDEEDAHSKNKK